VFHRAANPTGLRRRERAFVLKMQLYLSEALGIG
jgi:hypothetical protein